MSRTRVLYVLGSLVENETAEEILAVLGRLSRSSFDPRVVALGGRDDLSERIHDMKVRLYPLGLTGSVGAYRAVGRVRKLVRSTDAEILHGYGSWGGSVAVLAAGGRPVVRSIARAPTTESDVRGRVLRHLESRARGVGGTRFLVPNEGSRGLAVRAYGAAKDEVEVVPPSVDVAAIRERVRRATRDGARRLLGLRESESAFVFMTGLDSEAAADRLLSGVSVARVEDPDLRVFVLGSGRYEGPTRWKAEDLGLGDSLVFLGDDVDAGRLWAAADGAIDATRARAWSRTALGAMAAGVPVVKLQSGTEGWAEELDETLPVVSDVPERFAADLVRLAADPQVREQVLAHGREVVTRVDVGHVVARLERIYRSLRDPSGPAMSG